MPRPKRSAAMFAEEKIKAVLEWEELPESSSKFKQYAAQIEAEFQEEQKKKRVRVEDLDVSDEDHDYEDVEGTGNDTELDHDSVDGSTDEVPTREDLDFIEQDSDYESTDGEFVTAPWNSCLPLEVQQILPDLQFKSWLITEGLVEGAKPWDI